MTAFPRLGCGIGLRTAHYPEILDVWPAIDWLEVLTENYLVAGGRPLENLTRIREHYPVALHGVSLSIGSTDPLDERYLDAVAALARRIEPAWISDHLCWTGVGGKNGHDLYPLPYTEEALAHVVERVLRVEERLGRPLVLENVSSYVAFTSSTLTEWEFLAEVVRRTGAALLLDVNNVHVSAFNHGFDATQFLAGIPRDQVAQFHLAGYSDRGSYLFDTHDHAISDAVWRLYAEAVRRFGPVSTVIERDDAIPPLAEVLAEADRARDVQIAITHEARPSPVDLLGSRHGA